MSRFPEAEAPPGEDGDHGQGGQQQAQVGHRQDPEAATKPKTSCYTDLGQLGAISALLAGFFSNKHCSRLASTNSGHIFCKLGKRLNSTKSRFIFSQRNCLEDKNLFARETRWSFEAGLIRPQLSHFLLSHSSGCEIRIERLLADVGPFLLLILLMLKTRFKQIPIYGTNALLLATANDSMRRSTIAKKRNQ